MTSWLSSLPWIFMLCFACGQITDITSLEDSYKNSDEFPETINSTGLLFDDDQFKDENQTENGKLEAKEEESAELDVSHINENSSERSQIVVTRNETGTKGNARISSGNSEESTQWHALQERGQRQQPTGRGRRRPISYRTSSTPYVSEIPLMSQERRNSYLSIAERRKYYNKIHETSPRTTTTTTTTATTKLENTETELENQESVNKFVTSVLSPAVLENFQANEIPVSQKPTTKETGKETLLEGVNSMTEKRNQTGNPKIVLSLQPPSEKPKKLQNTRQSVIQSQYEFGQKLNSKRPVPRVPVESGETFLRRNKDKVSAEPIIENSTVKLLRSYPSLSTELLRVNKNLLTSTSTLAPEVFDGKNSTSILNVAEYVTLNRSSVLNLANHSINATAEYDFHESVSRINKSEPIKLPLNYNNLPSNAQNESTDNEEEVKKLESNIRSVYNQEILRLNTTRKTVKVPLNILKSHPINSKENLTETYGLFTSTTSTTTANPKTTLNPSPGVITQEALSTQEPLIPSPRTVGKESITNSGKPNGTENKFMTAGRSNEPIFNFTVNNFGEEINSTVEVTTPIDSITTAAKVYQSPSSVVDPEQEHTVAEAPKNHQDGITPLDHQNSMQKYPLTIELNENNKRLLSEMFDTSKTTESSKMDKHSTTTTTTTTQAPRRSSMPPVHDLEDVESSTQRTAITSSSATKVPSTKISTYPRVVVNPSLYTTEATDSMDNYQSDEDRKPMGTRYNTKFYISPNVSRTQQKVIKVTETEEEEEDDRHQQEGGGVSLVTRPIGITAYVLAAFGIIPLLLAAVFAAKFIMDRRQRRYECDSDDKSDSISTSECQTRQSKRRKLGGDLKKSPSNVTTTTLVTTSRLPRVHHHWLSPEKQGSKNWEIPRSKLKMKTILGQGNFGQVWKAEVEDMPGHEGKTRLVAVKTVKEGAGEKEHKEFIKELEIMQQIGSHPNIVTLLGCCTDQEPHYLIMEYVKYGKLLTYLREHRVNENYYNFSSNEDALTSKDLTVFAYCISQGMEYLVSRGIIHRDLAARNVLVDHNKVCKIADFGMSRSVRNFEDGQVYEERQHKGALPIRWMAPESLVYSVFTHKSDVWSFGIVMWEIVTLGSIPYPNMGAREIMRRVRDGYRLERPSHCRPEFYRLMSHCWTHDPNKRPDFSELREDLSRLLENPSKDGSYVDLDRFAVDNNYPMSSKSREFRKECRSLKRYGDWDTVEWPEETKRSKMKKARNNGKGTVTLTGQGSFTVNSRILEKEFKMI